MKVHKTSTIKNAPELTIVDFKKSFNLKNEVVPLENMILVIIEFSENFQKIYNYFQAETNKFHSKHFNIFFRSFILFILFL